MPRRLCIIAALMLRAGGTVVSRKATQYFLGAALALLPASAYANAGLPMIAVAMPAFVVALIPIILIEAYVFKRAGFPFKWALQRNAIANAVTTFIGIPLTWGVLLALQVATVGADCSEATDTWPQKIFAVVANSPWMCPFETELKWMVPTAMLILLVPFFFASWLIESRVIRMMGKSFDAPRITAVCLRANLVTYALLALYPISIYFVAYLCSGRSARRVGYAASPPARATIPASSRAAPDNRNSPGTARRG